MTSSAPKAQFEKSAVLCRRCDGSGHLWIPCADFGSVRIACSCRSSEPMLASGLLVAIFSSAIVVAIVLIACFASSL